MTDRATEIAAMLTKLADLLTETNMSDPRAEQKTIRTPLDRDLFTVEEAAQRLGIGRTTTYALVRSGELDSVRIGRLRRIPKKAIGNYVARLSQHPQTSAPPGQLR